MKKLGVAIAVLSLLFWPSNAWAVSSHRCPQDGIESDWTGARAIGIGGATICQYRHPIGGEFSRDYHLFWSDCD